MNWQCQAPGSDKAFCSPRGTLGSETQVPQDMLPLYALVMKITFQLQKWL